jgi:exodeoxyribonuclease-5
MEAGVPVPNAISFLTNPLTRDYAAKQRIIKSEYGLLAGVSDSNPKKQAAAQILKDAIPALKNKNLDAIRNDYLYKNNIYSNAVSLSQEVLGDQENFDLSKMDNVRSKRLKDKYALAMFMHFLEIEQYLNDNTQVKMLAKPDTKVYGSPQEVAAVSAKLNLLESGNVDIDLIKKLKEDSLLSSFFDYEFGIALAKGVMPGINNSGITQYIQDLLSGQIKTASGEDMSKLVTAKYKGATGTQRFVKEYKNAIRNFVYQNFLTNTMNEKGDLVNLPTSFRGLPVVVSKEGFARGIKLENGKFYINKNLLENDFEQKRYLGKNTEDKLSYYNRKLPFFSEDVFDSKSSFYKYLFEREYLRKIYSIESIRNTKEFDSILNLAKNFDDFNSNKEYYEKRSFEEYLSRIALINTFNRHAIMKQSDASYTQRVVDAVEEMKKTPSLVQKFPILNQITSFKDVRGNYVLTLNDRDILEGQLAEIYHQNLTQLADINVKKAKNPDENKRITDLFKMFSKVLIYQHGVGKTKYGINQALPQEEYEMIMSAAFPVFIEKHMNTNSLNYVLGTAFKDYTVHDINLYNTAGVEIEVPMDEEEYVAPEESETPTTLSNEFDASVVPQPQAGIVKASITGQGSDINIEVQGENRPFLLTWNRNRLTPDLFGEKTEDGVFKTLSDPETGAGVYLSQEDIEKAVNKYIPKNLLNLLNEWTSASKLPIGEVLNAQAEILKRIEAELVSLGVESSINVLVPVAPVQPQTPEKKEGEYEFEFSDGFKVYTPFALNTEQKNALLRLEEYSRNPKSFQNRITLLGYAGTGKTTIMSLFTQYLKNNNKAFKLTSPTHRANTVTKAKNPDQDVYTLAKTFGLKPEIQLENPGTYTSADLVWDHKKRGESKVQPGDVLIIDEASMVTDDLYQMINDATEDMNLKVIYMGDPGQAEPVQERQGLSSVFEKGTQIKLTKVERTGDNPILNESTRLRSVDQNGNLLDMTGVSAEKNGKGVLYVNQNNNSDITGILNTELNNLINGENPLSFRILSGTNKITTQYNSKARYALFKDQASTLIHNNEILMGYNTVPKMGSEEDAVANSVDYKVRNVEKTQKSITLDYINKGSVVSEKLNIDGYTTTIENVYSGGTSDIFIVDHITDKTVAAKIAYAISYYETERARLKQFSDELSTSKKIILQDKIENLQRNLVLMTNIYISKNSDFSNGFIENNQVGFKVNQKNHPNINKAPTIEKSIDYGYAHTIHKSQGGTYNKVLIIDESIKNFKFGKQKGLELLVKEGKISMTPQEIKESVDVSGQKLKYVAVSRASDYVYYIAPGGFIKSTSKPVQQPVAVKPVPSVPTVSDKVKVTKSGTMNFQYDGLQTGELKQLGITNTFDAILAGKRTATTRYINTSKKTFDYWANTKVGDVIEFWSGKKVGEGKSVKVEVTRIVPVDWTQMSPEDVADWTGKEGWDGYALWDNKQKTGYKGIQIQFRILGTPTQRKNNEDDNADDENNLTCNPF